MAGERELRRNLTATNRVIKRARLSAYLAIMGTRHISTRLLVTSQQQLGLQVAVEGHRRSPRPAEVRTSSALLKEGTNADPT